MMDQRFAMFFLTRKRLHENRLPKQLAGVPEEDAIERSHLTKTIRMTLWTPREPENRVKRSFKHRLSSNCVCWITFAHVVPSFNNK
jgi:hypothetical protein